MAAKDHLQPVRSKQEASERGRKGGIASGKARRAKKLAAKTYSEAVRELMKRSYRADLSTDAVNALPEETYAKIVKGYEKVPTGLESKEAQYADEANAYYAEMALGNMEVVRYLVEGKPSLQKRILSFFKKASADYAGIPKLDRAAKKYLKQFKKAFDALAAENTGALAAREAVDDVLSAVEDSGERYALPEALKTLGEYDSVRVRHIESSGKDRVVRDYNEIKEFINRSKSNPPFERLHIGIISDKTASFVKKCTGEDITGYDFVLASNFVFHIYDSHGNEATEVPRGQKAVDDINIENIIETVIAPDDVSLVSDSTGTALRFERILEGRNVAITITSTKKSTLTLKSAWIINEKSGGRTPSANANALAGTPEANSRSSTNNIIPETAEKINPSDEISSKKSSKGQLALPLEEVDGHSAAAQREFGTTTDFAQAGFVLQDGRMLKLSQYGQRGVQHKIIERVFDDAKGGDAVNRFIQEGNIRIKAESQGIEIGTERAPTVSQLNTVSRFISSSLRGKGYLYLDITDKNGNDVASVMYTDRDSPSGVISDIKDYYARGRMPVPYDDMRYSIDLDSAGEMGYNYTEEQYEHFGWARHAEAITKNELDDLNSKLQEKKILRRFRQSARGEAIVEVNDKPHTTLGVDNVFAFVKGSATDPQITRVLRVSLFSETDMEKVRKFIYDNERRAHARTSVAVGNFFFEKGLFTEFARKDFGSYQEYRAEIGKRSVRSESEGDQAYDRSRYERERHLRRSEDDVVYSLPLEDLTPAEERAQEERQRDIPSKRRKTKEEQLAEPKDRAEKKIKAIFSTEGSYEILRSVYGLKDLSPKSIHEMCNKIWRGMSACVSAEEKAALADDTADYILSKLMSEDRSKKNPEAEAAKEELAYLRRGIGRLTFSDTDVAELTHAFDKTGFPYLGTPVPQGVTFQPPSGE